ncbi:MAG TPA: hypothetical protein VEC59_11555 [Steroidobacteraceae bacterium]|nr:hypothetical protein [Steroidobacteraceae bacterium]
MQDPNPGGDSAPRLNFPLHFALLAGLVLLYLRVLARMDLGLGTALGGHLIFAFEGALYGLTIALALRAPAVMARRALFVVLSAACSVAATHAGVWSRDGVEWLLARGGRELSSRAEDTLAIAATAAFGALAYGFLVRVLWLPRLRRTAPLLIALGCTAAMMVLAAAVSAERNLEWFIVLWWLAFSAGLWGLSRWRGPADARIRSSRA